MGSNKLKTKISSRIQRLSIISVLVCCAIYLIFGTLGLDYIIFLNEKNTASKNSDILTACYDSSAADMFDLADELSSDDQLINAVNLNDVSSAAEIMETLATDSWIQGILLENANGEAMYTAGIEVRKDSEYYVSGDGILTMVSSSDAGSGKLYLASYPNEIGAVVNFVENGALDYSVYYDNQLIYGDIETTLPQDLSEIAEVKNGSNTYTLSFIPYNENIVFVAREDISDSKRSEMYIVIILVAIAALLTSLSVGITLPVVKAITTPILNIESRLRTLADGDLHSPVIKRNRGDETQLLEDSLGAYHCKS